MNKKHSGIKETLFQVLVSSDSENRMGKIFNIGMLILIILNIIAVILETEQEMFNRFKGLFFTFEIFSVVIFTIEYLLRLWVCTLDKQYSHPISGRLKYMFQPLQIIDLLAFLPFYLPLKGLDLRFIRAVRLFRLFRLFKIGRYSESIVTLGNVVKKKREELSITLFAGFIVLILSSVLMYFVEHTAQPSIFQSIPDAMWWAVSTLTTVGYGDIFPITALGKFLGSAIALLGVGLLAMPAGIIASGFITEIHNKKNSKKCPHCGKTIEE